MNREAEREHKIRARLTDSVVQRIILGVMRLFRSRLPVAYKAPPTGPDWIHEIKHDGFGSSPDATAIRSA